MCLYFVSTLTTESILAAQPACDLLVFICVTDEQVVWNICVLNFVSTSTTESILAAQITCLCYVLWNNCLGGRLLPVGLCVQGCYRFRCDLCLRPNRCCVQCGLAASGTVGSACHHCLQSIQYPNLFPILGICSNAQVECLAAFHAQRPLGDCSDFHVVVVLLGPLKPRRLLGDSRNMHDFSRFSVAYVS